jgi:hypothetical protein
LSRTNENKRGGERGGSGEKVQEHGEKMKIFMKYFVDNSKIAGVS